MNLQFLTDITPKKTSVSFFHAITGELIGVQKILIDELPASFNKPTVIDWRGAQWRVLRAEPLHAKEFTLNRKLTLHVQENKLIDISKLGYNLATVNKETPVLNNEPLYTDFLIDISEDHWKQLEFLPVSSLPTIQEHLSKIAEILFPESSADTLAGYPRQYIRTTSPGMPLGIPLRVLCSFLNIFKKGSIRFADQGIVQNGIALRSDNYTYYAIVKDEVVMELFLHAFESVDEEFFQLTTSYNLLLIDWCKAKVIMM